jgi:hypothetical protein
MLQELKTGGTVEHNGAEIGSVEQVLNDAILVRHGRADYLLRIPEHYLKVASPQRVLIDAELDLDEIERTAIDSGRAPPTGEHITEAEHTQPSPKPEGTIGESAGMPPSYDGPATG